LLFHFISYVLNMFRTLIYPSSGACDYSVELPHWSYCSWFDMCCSFSVVGLEWYPCCRLQPAARIPLQPNHTETPTHIEPRTDRQIHEFSDFRLLYARSSLFWAVMQRILTVTEHSGQPIDIVFKCQGIQGSSGTRLPTLDDGTHKLSRNIGKHWRINASQLPSWLQATHWPLVCLHLVARNRVNA